MRDRSKFISDMAQMANGAASALGGLREEIDNIVKQRTERSLNSRGLVTREEFDALRTRHEALAARLATLGQRSLTIWMVGQLAPRRPNRKAQKRQQNRAGRPQRGRAKRIIASWAMNLAQQKKDKDDP